MTIRTLLRKLQARACVSAYILTTGDDRLMVPDVLTKTLAASIESQRRDDRQRVQSIVDWGGKKGRYVGQHGRFRPFLEKRTPTTRSEPRQNTPYTPTVCLTAIAVLLFATVSSSLPIARSMSRRNPGSSKPQGILPRQLLDRLHDPLDGELPGLPKAGLPTRDFVSPPAKRTLRTATPRPPSRLFTNRRKSWMILSPSSSRPGGGAGRSSG